MGAGMCFVGHFPLGVLCQRYWQKDANGGAVILRIIVAFDLDVATVPFDQLFRDKQTNACSHGTATGEEGIEYSRESLRGDSNAVILDRQDDAVIGRVRVIY